MQPKSKVVERSLHSLLCASSFVVSFFLPARSSSNRKVEFMLLRPAPLRRFVWLSSTVENDATNKNRSQLKDFSLSFAAFPHDTLLSLLNENFSEIILQPGNRWFEVKVNVWAKFNSQKFNTALTIEKFHSCLRKHKCRSIGCSGGRLRVAAVCMHKGNNCAPH